MRGCNKRAAPVSAGAGGTPIFGRSGGDIKNGSEENSGRRRRRATGPWREGWPRAGVRAEAQRGALKIGDDAALVSGAT